MELKGIGHQVAVRQLDDFRRRRGAPSRHHQGDIFLRHNSGRQTPRVRLGQVIEAMPVAAGAQPQPPVAPQPLRAVQQAFPEHQALGQRRHHEMFQRPSLHGRHQARCQQVKGHGDVAIGRSQPFLQLLGHHQWAKLEHGRTRQPGGLERDDVLRHVRQQHGDSAPRSGPEISQAPGETVSLFRQGFIRGRPVVDRARRPPGMPAGGCFQQRADRYVGIG